MTAAARTVLLPGNRVARLVEADDAGEFTLEVSEYLIKHLEAKGLLDWRQITAAHMLARLYGKGGGRRPFARGSGGDREPDRAAWDEYEALLEAIPAGCPATARRDWDKRVVKNGPLCKACNCARKAVDLLAGGEWITEYDPMPKWRHGLDAVADRLKLARVEEGADE